MAGRTANLVQQAGRILAPLVVLIVGIGGFLALGKRQPATTHVPERVVPLVQTLPSQPFGGHFTMNVDGVSTPFRQIALAAEVDGQIQEKADQARAGRYVRAGDILLQIDSRDYRLDLQRLESQQRQASEELSSVDVDLENSQRLIQLADEDVKLRQRELQRRESLRRQNAVSESELDESRQMELAARNSLQTLRNQVVAFQQKRRSLKAALDMVGVQMERARLDLERTVVRAPLSGTVVEDLVEKGDYVRAGDVLIRISDTSRMEVRCSLRIEELYWVWLQAGLLTSSNDDPSVRMEIPSVPVKVVYSLKGEDFVWDGVLSRYEGSGLDSQTRTVPCRVLIQRPSGGRTLGDRPSMVAPTLLSGMYVSIRIPIEPPIPLVEIPPEALQPGNRVWVVRDGQLFIRTVEVAWSGPQATLIRQTADGIQPGDLLVVSPLAAVEDGMLVEVTEEQRVEELDRP